jgi:hypothetical protein
MNIYFNDPERLRLTLVRQGSDRDGRGRCPLDAPSAFWMHSEAPV